jgi:hypothetical protein
VEVRLFALAREHNRGWDFRGAAKHRGRASARPAPIALKPTAGKEPRYLEFAVYAFGAGTIVALAAIAVTVEFGLVPGRGNVAAFLLLVGAAAAAVAAWRVWQGDAAIATGALAYVSVFVTALAAVILIVSPAILAVILTPPCERGQCLPVQILTGREQTGYMWAVVASAISVVADFVAVLLLTTERHRRRRL